MLNNEKITLMTKLSLYEQKYTNKEIDFFMTEQDGIFYLYPAPEEGLKEKTLRVCPTKSGQTKGISFAKDYIFEEVIKNY